MAAVWAHCMKYLRSYGYPEYSTAICNRYFQKWINAVLGNNEALQTWKERIESSPHELLFKIACGMWLAGQLYNHRQALVDIAIKAEEPDIMSPDTYANLKEKILAWRIWNREQRPLFAEFLKIPDLDEKLLSNSATLYVPREKRQRVALPSNKTFSVIGVKVFLEKGNQIVMGFLCDDIRYFSTRHFLYSLGITGVINDPISRPMSEEEIAFIKSLPVNEQLGIFGTLTDWEKQTVFCETDFETLAKAQRDPAIQFKLSTCRRQ